jgi:DNA mismatch repair protein MutS2
LVAEINGMREFYHGDCSSLYSLSSFYAILFSAMDEKTLVTLEYPKILERLAGYASFGVSAEMARALRPVNEMNEARLRLAFTTEARRLLEVNDDFSIGGARDIRAQVDLARRAGVLDPSDLLDVKNTLIAARNVARTLERQVEPLINLKGLVPALLPPSGLIDAITRAISERGEVLDSASDKLGRIRSELKIAHDRLMSRLERLINDPKNAPILQDQLITQRNGRYVIPLRAEFKGRIRSIVHDQSSSGATLFVEPLATVELNNTWHELQLAERDEVRRILAELSAEVGRNAEWIAEILTTMAQLDLALMCAKYGDDLHAVEPVLVPPRPVTKDHPGSTIRLFQARHPLLDPATVVAIDVDLDMNTFGLVITGPNTGGKTVSLKTVGLLVLMAQSGLHIPALSGCTLSLFEDVYADIGDEQSIEQSLSTFSGHITNIVRILERASTRTIVLLDELGAGTDPQEGAVLARALLSHLVENKIPCLVATHYPELKAFAHATPGIVNASMEFNLETLRPTYHLTIGLPGRSNALLIAERLGLPQAILADARSELDPEDLRAEDLLDEIHRQRDLARQARHDAEEMRADIERSRQELTTRLEKMEDERLALLDRARSEAEKEVSELRQELEDVRRSLERARQPLDAIKALQEQAESMEDEVRQPVERRQVAQPAPRPLKTGQRVRLRSLNMEGIVTAIGESEVEVQMGALRVRARLNDIQRTGEPEQQRQQPTPARAPESRRKEKPSGSVKQVLRASPGMELDLRGERAEDALDRLSRYIDSAYLSGMPFVRIIHGKGTGRLRQVVREALRSSPHVKNFENGLEGEGGDGVTVAHLVD